MFAKNFVQCVSWKKKSTHRMLISRAGLKPRTLYSTNASQQRTCVVFDMSRQRCRRAYRETKIFVVTMYDNIIDPA